MIYGSLDSGKSNLPQNTLLSARLNLTDLSVTQDPKYRRAPGGHGKSNCLTNIIHRVLSMQFFPRKQTVTAAARGNPSPRRQPWAPALPTVRGRTAGPKTLSRKSPRRPAMTTGCPRLRPKPTKVPRLRLLGPYGRDNGMV